MRNSPLKGMLNAASPIKQVAVDKPEPPVKPPVKLPPKIKKDTSPPPKIYGYSGGKPIYEPA